MHLNQDIRYLLKEKYDFKESALLDLDLNHFSQLFSCIDDNIINDIEKLKKGYPIGYLIGYVIFNNLKIKVIDNKKKVLIPRIETENLLNFVIDNKIELNSGELFSLKNFINKKIDNIKVLDIFTGSGCIGLSVLSSFENINLLMSDIDASAISIAKDNFKINFNQTRNYKIDFIKSDIFENISQKYDVIFANPPYVKNSDYLYNIDSLKYEPVNAILSKNNGLEVIFKFIDQSFEHLKDDGVIFLEFGIDQQDYITNYFDNISKEVSYKVLNDQFNTPRWIIIKI